MKNLRQGWNGRAFNRSLVETGIVVMMVVVMVMAVFNHHDLRLRRIGCCEAEDESQCKQNFLHDSA